MNDHGNGNGSGSGSGWGSGSGNTCTTTSTSTTTPETNLGPNADWHIAYTNTIQYSVSGSGFTNTINNGPDTVANADAGGCKASSSAYGWSMLRMYPPNNPPSGFATSWSNPSDHNGHQTVNLYPKDEDNPSNLDNRCNTTPSSNNVGAYGNSDWNIDFSTQSPTTWNFSPPPVNQLTIPSLYAPLKEFSVYSMVNECIITEDTTVTPQIVAGFYTCKSLTIRARTTPLYMIGTFIVGALSIDPKAMESGIYWASIHHPLAVALLQAQKILTPFSSSTASCPLIPNSTDPLWNPVATASDVTDSTQCTSESLRSMAVPFTWTAVDPICGFDTTASLTRSTCKIHFRPLRYKMVEISRGEKL